VASALKKRRSRRRLHRARYVYARHKGFPQICEWVRVKKPRSGQDEYAVCTRLIGPEKIRLMSYVWGRGALVFTVKRNEIEPVGGGRKR